MANARRLARSLGQTTITLDALSGASCSMTPAWRAPERPLVCFFTMLMPSTITALFGRVYFAHFAFLAFVLAGYYQHGIVSLDIHSLPLLCCLAYLCCQCSVYM